MAKQHAYLPYKSKGRIILENAAEVETTITINQKRYKLPQGKGAGYPQDGTTLDVAAGT